MSLAQAIQSWVDGLFGELEADYARRPLILAVIARVQKAVDAQIPQLVTEGAASAKTALAGLVVRDFALLEAEVASSPFLVELLSVVRDKIVQEIDAFTQEIET